MVAVPLERVPTRPGPPSLRVLASDLDDLAIPRRRVAMPAQAGTGRMSDILSAWRTAERALADHRVGSRELAILEAEVGAWRAAYHRAFAELRRRHHALRGDDARGVTT